MSLVKPDMTNIWASGGDIVEPSNLKKQQGWTVEVPPHQFENWIQNRQDAYLAHINQRGIPAWDGLTNYLASGLSYVQGTNGKVYKSVAASGPAGVVSNPVTDVAGTYWTVAFADVGAFLTQAAGDTRYAQRSNNLSDVSNAATARTNLGIVQATDTTSGLVELATSAETITGTDTVRAITPAGLASLTATDARRGLVELATTAEAQAGTRADVAVTPAALASLVKDYTSSPTTYANGGQLTFNHGLGVVPSVITWQLTCVIAQGGYSVGDVLFMPVGISGSGGSTGIITRATSTQIIANIGSAGLLTLTLPSGSGGTTLTPANWTITARAKL